jgi:predicted lipoprotein with Yx(FWY)xxD motif
MKRSLILGAAVAVAVIAVAAVAIAAVAGGGGDSTGSAAPSPNTATVSTEQIGDAGEVLVDPEGRALYAAEQEIDAGMVLCTEACTSFWTPLTVSDASPTADSSVSGEVGVVERPDGTRQVALDGKLLYSFVEDEPGEVTGDGFEDAFDGQTLTWRVVHADGSTGSSGGDTPAGPFDY